MDTFDATRIQLGINDFNFRWRLEPGEAFQAPEALLAYSDHGLNALSHAFHNTVRDRLAREPWRHRERPVLINNWEATYFDFTEDRLLELARTAKRAGIELFVLDDGWFGRGGHARTSDSAGLGDWTPNPDRLPDGIAGIARKINDLGMKFGLWFEPEMINEASDLFEAHPDWVLSTPGRDRSVYRHQYVLNFANPAVVDHIFDRLHALLAGANVAYVKWDMNRFVTEAYDATRGAERQGEVMHRYILGVYDLYERLLAAFPELIIEGCASGGARFDLGILAYSPQIWTSDDTDAVERLGIQWGTSYVYPVEAMGAHVSITPNHQTGRSEPLNTRANVALFGTFGYEMDLTRASAEDLEAIRSQVAFFKRFGPLVHWGDFHRLRSPFAPDRRSAAWMVVAMDGSEALVADYAILCQPNRPNTRLRLRGLEPEALYRVRTVDPSAWDWPGANAGNAGNAGDEGRTEEDRSFVRSGAELMHIGINDTDLGGRDFASRLYLVTRL
ncbi:alpha-galactosidase [Bifidobacterium avesanii]|nr:alpha-galactosidase [Bifidobacterium avesanii]